MNRPAWRVLVADDDPTARLLTQAALGGDDFALTLTDNGTDALAAFRQAPFDIALIDVEMPGLDGFEVCAAIRQSHGERFPLVLLSGRSDPVALERMRQLGASHLVKPVDWGSLGDYLRARLAAASP
ncbi:MAG: Response regulator receiver [Proteobacteria bacterium]|nr:Response regulator receiver [Pseudomonadota bacterium]